MPNNLKKLVEKSNEKNIDILTELLNSSFIDYSTKKNKRRSIKTILVYLKYYAFPLPDNFDLEEWELLEKCKSVHGINKTIEY